MTRLPNDSGVQCFTFCPHTWSCQLVGVHCSSTYATEIKTQNLTSIVVDYGIQKTCSHTRALSWLLVTATRDTVTMGS